MNKKCFPPALFEGGHAGEIAGGTSASAGETSVKLDDSRVNPFVNG